MRSGTSPAIVLSQRNSVEAVAVEHAETVARKVICSATVLSLEVEMELAQH